MFKLAKAVASPVAGPILKGPVGRAAISSIETARSTASSIAQQTDGCLSSLQNFIRSYQPAKPDTEQAQAIRDQLAAAEQLATGVELLIAVGYQIQAATEQARAARTEASGDVKTFALSPAAATFNPSVPSPTAVTPVPSELSPTAATFNPSVLAPIAATLTLSELSPTAATFSPSVLLPTAVTFTPSESLAAATSLDKGRTASISTIAQQNAVEHSPVPDLQQQPASPLGDKKALSTLPIPLESQDKEVSASHEKDLPATFVVNLALAVPRDNEAHSTLTTSLEREVPAVQQDAVGHSLASGSQQLSATPLGDNKAHSTLPIPLERQVSAAQYKGASTSNQQGLASSIHAPRTQQDAVDYPPASGSQQRSASLPGDKESHSTLHVPKRQIAQPKGPSSSSSGEQGLASSIHAPRTQQNTAARAFSSQQQSATPVGDKKGHSTSHTSKEQATAQHEGASTSNKQGLAASIYAPGAQQSTTARAPSSQQSATPLGDKTVHSTLHVTKRQVSQHEGASTSNKQGLAASIYAPGARKTTASCAFSSQQQSATSLGDKKNHSTLPISKEQVSTAQHEGASSSGKSGLALSFHAHPPQRNFVDYRASGSQQRSATPLGEKKDHSASPVPKGQVSTGQTDGASSPKRNGLADSIYAHCHQEQSVTSLGRKNLLSVFSAFAPATQLKAASSSSVEVSTVPRTPGHKTNINARKSRNMSPVADVDDTAGFMAAVRALKLSQSSTTSNIITTSITTTPVAAEEISGEQGNTWKGDKKSIGVSDSASVDADHAESASVASEAGSIDETAKYETSGVSKNALSFATEAGALMGSPEQEEDRENLATFETWGTPAARGKPAARVRTITIKDLPSTWATPAKVLSLVHGGLIESVSVSPMGTAHVRFCDADACKAFYDKYPNGIDLDKSRKVTVFVEMGKDVNVVSSQLSFNLSVGATRVVRAVGVDLDVTMTQMIRLATAQNRKIEKIVDSCVPGEARSASFRFCSIEDAVRFRAALIRDPNWEHCNVQYGIDPCDSAVGMHID